MQISARADLLIDKALYHFTVPWRVRGGLVARGIVVSGKAGAGPIEPDPTRACGMGEEEVGRGVYGTPSAAPAPVPWARIIPETLMCTAARIFSYIYNACRALRAERG